MFVALGRRAEYFYSGGAARRRVQRGFSRKNIFILVAVSRNQGAARAAAGGLSEMVRGSCRYDLFEYHARARAVKISQCPLECLSR